MFLIRNIIEDPGLDGQWDALDLRYRFIRELASVILPSSDGFETVLRLANQVYDRHCSPQAGWLNGCHFDRPVGTALSA